MGQIKFIGSLIFIAIFFISLLAFAVEFGNDNSDINIADDDDYSSIKTSIEGNVSSFYLDVQTANNATQESTISSQTESTEGGTAFKVTPASALRIVKSAIKSPFSKIFGSDSDFTILSTAFISMLVLISSLYIWKTWAGRNPD